MQYSHGMLKELSLAAMAKGEITFLSPKPCGKGHVGLRSVYGWGCVECKKVSKRKYDIVNREKINLQHMIRNGNNQEKMKAAAIKYRDSDKYYETHYGMVPTRPRPILCEACDEKPVGKLHFDHCHKTMKFRGWLCNGCNRALGAAADNIEILEMLIQYMKKNGG